MNRISYKTIRNSATAELKVKGSKFIVHARHVETPGQAEKVVEEISKQYHDATHNCFAYRVGCLADTSTRQSDDGEPSGTAGRPILNVILGRRLTNVVVVVTRYFGGTKLGTGGLVRAYTDSTNLALQEATIVIKYLSQRLQFSYPYVLTGQVDKLVNKYNAQREHVDYSVSVDETILIRKDHADAFIEELTHISGGKIKVNTL
jgi:uncharacterized YigZ family protein